MAAYLTDHPPVRDQWYKSRNRPLTGCTVLHTAESIMDTIGPDTGAEAVAEFIRRRSDPGSYHDICDSDSALNLVDYRHGAYHDGTGSNNWALALAFACRTSDWRAMSPAKRKAFLRQGAIAFARQQAYRRSIGAPLTELRLISKAQSDAGMSGFTYHGFRDPGRRTDPGVAPPNLFPFDEFITEVRAVMSGEEDDMSAEAEKMIAEIHGKVVGSQLDYRPHHGMPTDDLLGHVMSVRLGLDQILPEVPNVRKAGDVFRTIWYIKQTVEALTATVADMVDKGSGDLTEERFRQLLAESVVQVDIDVRGGTATGPAS